MASLDEASGHEHISAINVTILYRNQGPASPEKLQSPENSWRQSRLAWLDSTAGISTTPAFPFTPVTLDSVASRLGILGRQVTLNRFGLPSAIECGGGVGAPFTPGWQPVLRGQDGVQLTLYRAHAPYLYKSATAPEHLSTSRRQRSPSVV